MAYSGRMPLAARNSIKARRADWRRKVSENSRAFRSVIPRISASFSGSSLSTSSVRAPNLSSISVAVAAPMPLTAPEER